METVKALAVILMVRFRAGYWEEYAYGTASEANAFTHAVQTYHSTGVCSPGDEWYGDVIEIVPRGSFHSVN